MLFPTPKPPNVSKVTPGNGSPMLLQLGFVRKVGICEFLGAKPRSPCGDLRRPETLLILMLFHTFPTMSVLGKTWFPEEDVVSDAKTATCLKSDSW